jgi:hypothetical protein
MKGDGLLMNGPPEECSTLIRKPAIGRGAIETAAAVLDEMVIVTSPPVVRREGLLGFQLPIGRQGRPPAYLALPWMTNSGVREFSMVEIQDQPIPRQ